MNIVNCNIEIVQNRNYFIKSINVVVVVVELTTLRSNPKEKENKKLLSRLDSMHTFFSRTIIIVIPLSMQQSCAVYGM